jgi:8-oxo-dGTP pyrophosphatase MutT (NUDIX family)
MIQGGDPGANERFREALKNLRAVVRAADGLLTDPVLIAVRSFHAALLADPESRSEFLRFAPEYGRLEFLACVDTAGAIPPASSSVVGQFRAMAGQHPDFGLWLELQEKGQSRGAFLLAARWLCHLAGLRHRTVQLFLDHPRSPQLTLAQVRGLNRPESPGCFDMPAAGHVAGLMAADHALLKELQEELGLRSEDLDGLRESGAYVYSDPPDAASCGVEHRTVYRARHMQGALETLSFPDAEVAGIAIFAVPDLADLIRTHPERIASGLAASSRLFPGLAGEPSQ